MRTYADAYGGMLGDVFRDASFEGFWFEVLRDEHNELEEIDINWKDSEGKKRWLQVWERNN